MADNYDFQINDLKFRMAERRDLPYVRSTAPFRKEQLDTSSTVGDQSLTGWWTRGQLSFHKGAGLNYYEVLEGEAVLNRYKESEHVKVFELGEVTLDKVSTALTQHADFTGIKKAIPGGGLPEWKRLWALDAAGYLFFHHASGVDKVVANDTTSIIAVAGQSFNAFISTSGRNVEWWNGPAFSQTTYNHAVGYTVEAMSTVKDRLWMYDSSGFLYVKEFYPTGAPVALASPICRIRTNGLQHNASFADGGGAVFMSVDSNKVYSFTPASDGSIATLADPVTAAVLPEDERIVCIEVHMGLLVMATNRGVRFAAIDGDSLTVGPLVVKWSNSECKNIATKGTFAYVTGEEEDSSTVCYEFDLTDPTSSNPLVCPYRVAWRGAQSVVDGGSNTGAVAYWDGIVFWGGDTATEQYFEGTQDVTDLEPTGYVKTAYHRFGTLDNKRFLKVVVRAKGTGTIEVFQVDADETETSLGTMNASAGVATFDIAETDAVERMAFKFVLSRDSGDATAGPTLLGYQIKALPVPDRHELLRVPLVIADFVALRHGTRVGTQGKGYSDLMALKALESATAIVTYTDHRTGETGSAYIDSVEFQDNQPATHNDNGFGGFAYVTLRVLE